METAPFACGICGEKFEKIVKFYLHLGEHNVLIQKEFHVCDADLSSRTEDNSSRRKKRSSNRVKNEEKKDNASTSALYICKACSCTFSSLCLLHNHISQCFGSGSYVFDAEHNTAYPIKSICSFFDPRNDIQGIADIQSHNSDSETVDGEKSPFEDIENEDHTFEGRITPVLDDTVSLESTSISCVKEEPGVVNNIEEPGVVNNIEEPSAVNNIEDPSVENKTEKTNEPTEVGDKTDKSAKKEVSKLVMELFDIPEPSQKQYTQITRKGTVKIIRDAPKQNVKQNIKVKRENRKRKRQASNKKSEQISADKSNKKRGIKSKFPCKLCDKVFDYVDRWETHMISHTTERTHKCELCPRAFKYEKGLKQHMVHHTGELLFCCDTCGERFTIGYKLKQHIIVKHMTEKPHKCDQCGAAFKRPYGLVRHALQHSETRPHQCEVCGVGFTRQAYLDQHRWTHNEKARRFPCSQCDRRFFTNYQLQCHLKVHTGERPYRCKLCTSGFIQKKELRKHMKKCHNLNLDDMERADADLADSDLADVDFANADLTDVDLADEAERDHEGGQTGLVTELPGEVVEDGIVYDNVETQSNVYQDMDTQSTDNQETETQSTVTFSNIAETPFIPILDL